MAFDGYLEDAVTAVKDSLKAAKHGFWPWQVTGDPLPARWKVTAVSRDGLIVFAPGELLSDGKWYVAVDGVVLSYDTPLLLDVYELPTTGVSFELVYNRARNSFRWTRCSAAGVGDEAAARTSGWSTVREAYWDRHWWAVFDDAIGDWADEVEARPGSYTAYAEAMIRDLRAIDADLTSIQAITTAHPGVVDDDDRAIVSALTTRYRVLAAGIYAVEPEIGVVQVGAGVVVLGVVVGVVGIAWAIVAYPYTANCREQTALELAELQARVEASQSGRELPSSTLPERNKVPWSLVATGITVVAGAGLLWWSQK